MKSMLLYALFFIVIINVTSSKRHSKDGDEHEDYDTPHQFNYDPHSDDPDYDHDAVAGSTHHEEKSKQQIKKELENVFKNIDTNNDTKITMNELVTYLIGSFKKLHNESAHESFAKVDYNKDKMVTLDEYCLYEHGDPMAVLDNYTVSDNSSESKELKKRLEQEKLRFKAADNDGNGSLDAHEFVFFKFPVFYPHMAHTIVHDYIEDLDANKDGKVDINEYITHFHITDNKNKTQAEESLKKVKEDFEKYDKNKDGKIDAEEYFAILKPGYEEPARTEAEFLMKETDNNKNGHLTLGEVERHSHLWLGGEPLGAEDGLEDDDDDDDDDDDEEGAHHADDEL